MSTPVNSSSGRQGEDKEGIADSPVTPNDEYNIDIVRRKTAGGYTVEAETKNHGPVAGEYVRQMIEGKSYDIEAPIFLGYDDAAREGFREIGFAFESFKRHMWISGTTGAGKTTVMHNKALHHTFGNHGFCNIDPKADGDTLELLQRIPNVRLDDVIFIEPGSSEFDRTIGINILDVPAIPDPDEREKEISNRLENLTAIFDNEDYWGVNMESITESVGRAMLRHNAEISLDDSADPSEKYSVIDMYFILLKQERREDFAETVDDPYLKDFLNEIAEMDDDEVRPLLKRIKKWVENPIVRRIIAQRESTIDWDEIVDEGKILLVRIPVDNQDVHQMITLTVLRNIWSAKKRQVRDDTRPDDQPYFVQVDEFEKVANENLNMDGMLARARSFWLSVCLGTQYPNQIKVDHEPILRAMENNCNTLLAMKTPGSKDSRILMQRFNDYDATDLINTNKHRTWTKIPLPDGTESEPVNIKTFPPYPPLRDETAAKAAIYSSLERYGTDPITEEEIQDGLKVGDIGELTNPKSAGHDELAKMKEDVTFEMVPDEVFLESIYAAQIRYNGVDEPVPKPKVLDALHNRVGEVGFESQISNIFERHADIRVSDERINGEISVQLTEPGINKVLSHDTGSSSTGGFDDHRWVLAQSYKTFTKLGAITRLPSQDESDELPDGEADLPIHPFDDADSMDEARELEAKLKDEYGRLYEIGNGRDISIEAETSTINKPTRTLRNLRKAVDKEKRCVFTCKDGYNDDDVPGGITGWPRKGQQLIFGTDSNGDIDYDTINPVSKVYPNGDRKFYNKTQKHTISSGRTVVAPKHEAHTQLEWRERNNKVVAISKRKGGTQDEVVHEFTSPEQAVDPPVATTLHREKQGEKYVVKEGKGEDAQVYGRYRDLDALQEDYMDLYPPVIPEIVFPREISSEDFCFIVFPDEDNPNFEADQPVLVDEDTVEPVFGEGSDITIQDDNYTVAENESEDGGEGGENTADSDPERTGDDNTVNEADASSDGMAAESGVGNDAPATHRFRDGTDPASGSEAAAAQPADQPDGEPATNGTGASRVDRDEPATSVDDSPTNSSSSTSPASNGHQEQVSDNGQSPAEPTGEQGHQTTTDNEGQGSGEPDREAEGEVDEPGATAAAEIPECYADDCSAREWTIVFGTLECEVCGNQPSRERRKQVKQNHPGYDTETGTLSPVSDTKQSEPSTSETEASQSAADDTDGESPEPKSEPTPEAEPESEHGEPTADAGAESQPVKHNGSGESGGGFIGMTTPTADSQPEPAGTEATEPAENGDTPDPEPPTPPAAEADEAHPPAANGASTPGEAAGSSEAPSSETAYVPDNPEEANDAVECPYSVAPSEVARQLPTDFAHDMEAIASGSVTPTGQAYQKCVEIIGNINTDAAFWIDGPADLQHVLETG